MSKKNKTIEYDANGHRKFGKVDKFAYAAGDFGCNMSFALKGTVQTFWLVFMYMETGVFSVLMLITQIWDALNDPLIGSLIDNDRRKYKLGKYKTYILVGACGLLFAGALVFIPLPDAIRMSQEKRDVIIKSIVFISAYVIWDACYTIANVPYGTMLSLVTEDKIQQAELSSWRSIGSAAGNVIGMVLPAIIWKKVEFDGTTDFVDKIEIPEGFTKEQFLTNPITGKPYQLGEKVLSPATHKQVEILLGERMFWIALVMGICGFAAFLFMIKKITIRVDENSVKTSEAVEKTNILKAFGTFMKNRPAVGATLAAMGMFIGMQSATVANTIMFATYFNMASLSGLVMAIGFIPAFAFMPFIKKIVAKHGKKEASVAGTVVSLLGTEILLLFPTIPYEAELFGVKVALLVYLLGLVIYGIGMGVYMCVNWAMMSDAIDYNEWKFGKREEGTVYAIHSFFRKLAQGVGPAAVVFVMGKYLGYEVSKGTVAQSMETTVNMCWLVACLYGISAILQFIGLAVIYNIDKKTLAQMQSDLAERHAANR